jgi:hypothetical protein
LRIGAAHARECDARERPKAAAYRVARHLGQHVPAKQRMHDPAGIEKAISPPVARTLRAKPSAS